MQDRLFQDLMAHKHFEASLIKEHHTGADRMPTTAGSGVFTKAQSHGAIKRKRAECQRTLFSILNVLILWSWKQNPKPQAGLACMLPLSYIPQSGNSGKFNKWVNLICI